MRIIKGLGLAAVLVGGLAAGVGAQTVAGEAKTLKGQKVTVYPHAFLTPEELNMLRLVQTNKDALALFVVSAGGHSAIAVSPKDGFVRNGVFAESVLAIGDLPSPEAAAAAAVQGCNEKRKGGPDCVVVLLVSPAG